MMNPALLTGIIVAGIGLIGTIGVALIRKPVSMQDMWSELRSLRADLTAADKAKGDAEEAAEVRDLARRKAIGLLVQALSIALRHRDDLYEHWGENPRPELSSEEKAVIATARELPPPVLHAA